MMRYGQVILYNESAKCSVMCPMSNGQEIIKVGFNFLDLRKPLFVLFRILHVLNLMTLIINGNHQFKLF